MKFIIVHFPINFSQQKAIMTLNFISSIPVKITLNYKQQTTENVHETTYWRSI